ncbi:hypothetical protein Tco_0771173 [Tanacetum coccineum]|uniref:Uncharacterized protein n=1 Tax=Tanacetum coccineum TaxID=301880 RepID=A0ABQ4ZH56_9ASTR
MGDEPVYLKWGFSVWGGKMGIELGFYLFDFGKRGRQNWWKPLTEDRPATPELAWSISSSDLPVLVNNLASALASTYAPPP